MDCTHKASPEMLEVRCCALMIRRCHEQDVEAIYSIINDGAQAYRGTIPADCFPADSPYMSEKKLQHEIDAGVVFWGYEEDGELLGVMGIQHVPNALQDVTLIRHAYVRTSVQKRGIGALLLAHLLPLTEDPVLIGTWADASWAVRFYQRHGFRMVPTQEKERLLQRYWHVPARQIETSVVLADARWWSLSKAGVEQIP